MQGKYEIKISNNKVSFSINLERNITIIRGDSATGKTTFISLLQDYEQYGTNSGISIQSQKPCRVLTSVEWNYRLNNIRDSFVFIDEGNEFVKSEAFANAIRNSDNYYVIITRENLYQLPYSVNSILKLKTTSRRAKTYVRSYPLYDNLDNPHNRFETANVVITEDSNAGYEMFAHISAEHNTPCIASNGKSNIFPRVAEHLGSRILVVADGAAFGAELGKLYPLIEEYPNYITLYLPESFEWLILKSGILGSRTPTAILQNPSEHIDSSLYFSWEQYFTNLLIQLTYNTPMHYSKHQLNHAYLHPANVAKNP